MESQADDLRVEISPQTPRKVLEHNAIMAVWERKIGGVDYQFFARLYPGMPTMLRVYVYDMRVRQITRRLYIPL